ncbi:MAG TPA: RsmB/NOP family class I SAM-dependent RNA methyltransferase [Sphingomicrobium sp.]
MTPQARVQAAIEILDEIIISTTVDGPPADILVSRYFKNRRYAGGSDRRAVREMVFRTIREIGDRPPTGRSAIYSAIGETRRWFDGSNHGPAVRDIDEPQAKTRLIPSWLQAELSTHVSKKEWAALLERAPVDLRVNVARACRNELLAEFPGAKKTPNSPWGIRLPADSRVDDHPAFQEGLVEVQDEGSQLIAAACEAKDDELVIDLCAGAGGKSLALAAAAPNARILATDSNRARLSKLPARAERAGAAIESRLLDPAKELEQLDDWRGTADLVLVDAPCSGSGTWRRNPEGRWRLTPERLDRLVALQARLLDIAAELVRPGGRLVYAVCSLLSREGAGQIQDFISRRSSWIVHETPVTAGRSDGAGRLLSPGHDGTDGFFVARLGRPC